MLKIKAESTEEIKSQGFFFCLYLPLKGHVLLVIGFRITINELALN